MKRLARKPEDPAWDPQNARSKPPP